MTGVPASEYLVMSDINGILNAFYDSIIVYIDAKLLHNHFCISSPKHLIFMATFGTFII